MVALQQFPSGYTAKSELSTDFIIADAVIVGKVPEISLINGDERGIISKAE